MGMKNSRIKGFRGIISIRINEKQAKIKSVKELMENAMEIMIKIRKA